LVSLLPLWSLLRSRPLRFSPFQGSKEFDFFGFPLLAFRSSSEFFHLTAAAMFPLRNTSYDCLPCGFFPFGVFPKVGSYLPPEKNHFPGYVAFSAFLTLSRLYSTHFLPALSHTGPTFGVSLSRVLRRPQIDSLSRASLPSCGFQATGGYRNNRAGHCKFLGVPASHPVRPFSLRPRPVFAPLQGFAPCGRLFFTLDLFARSQSLDPPELLPP
jgi:hypothetical protein